MKERIETIPVNEAFDAQTECPFCHLEKLAEQRTIRYVLGPGASYMEPDVRAATDGAGFCRNHYKKLYDFGNPLGSALMLQTHYAGLLEEFEKEAEGFTIPGKRSLFGKSKDAGENSLGAWAKRRTSSCYICDRLDSNMDRYIATFFYLLKEEQFREKVESGKGFCLHHFAMLMEQAEKELPRGQKQWFYDTVISRMRENLIRVKGDLDWFVGMFDYRNAGRPWNNAADAVPRGMQKIRGGHPADKPYKPE